MSNAKLPIYFDYNATTPTDPRVVKAMLPYFTENFGNPESSQHAYGWQAKNAVDRARKQVAGLLAANENEIIFTGGATESVYLAMFGFLNAQKGIRHIITSEVEHKATLEAAVGAKRLGHEVTFLPVNRYGQVEVAKLKAALRPNTALVTLMHANNEIGSLNPIAEIGALLQSQDGIAFHLDAAQTAGKHPIDVEAMGIDMLSLSAHKFYGPKGIGALYTRRPDIHLTPLIPGGGQERGLRGGTHNVPGIVGLGTACEIAMDEMANESERLRRFGQKITAQLASRENRIELNGHPTERVCNNVHLSLSGIGTDQLLSGLSDFALSTGSACSAGAGSHVLAAIGRGSSDPLTSVVRIGLGRYTTEAEVDSLISAIQSLVGKRERGLNQPRQ